MAKGVIICIDDDRTTLLSLRDQLSRITKCKYNIELAESGDEAFELLHEIKASSIEVPLIICDQIMPRMSGDEVLAKIYSEHPESRSILLTGQPNLEGVLKAINQANLYRYISKPWEETDLRLTVTEALRSYHRDRLLRHHNHSLRQTNKRLKEEIVKRQEIEKQLRYENSHDGLTNLANRNLLIERLNRAIKLNQTSEQYLFSVLFVDLQRFKLINDTLGYTIGDSLLIAVARRLENLARNTDTVARLGGDEFIILLEPLQDFQESIEIARQICEAFTLPFWVQDQEVLALPNVGIAFSDRQYHLPSQILRDADIAMHFSRDNQTPSYEVFQSNMHYKTVERLKIERDLNHALKYEELRVYYQPIVAVETQEVTGFEALVRWQHPTRGLVPPCDFIPIAERTGLIINIGEWVLKTACQQMKNWSLQFPHKNLKISVNISPRQLKDSDLIEKIDAILAKTGWNPHNLQLELTESMLMEDIEYLLKIFAQLASRNIQLSVDDFGTGYSSLSYLHRFPLNSLKVDRSFVKNIDKGLESKKIAELIVMLAHNLDMEVIAEGVETLEQLESLHRLNCKYAQGYLFSPAIPVEAATELISKM